MNSSRKKENENQTQCKKREYHLLKSPHVSSHPDIAG